MSEHWQAEFIDTAVSPSSVLRVKIPGFDNGVGSFVVTWSPLGNALPSAGDQALVVEADDGTWWAVSWESASQGVPEAADRTVAGSVTSAGAIAAGTGFTATRTATGLYTVTFTPPFASRPAVTVGIGITGGAYWVKLRDGVAPTVSVLLVTVYNNAASPALVDGAFEFVAVGP